MGETENRRTGEIPRFSLSPIHRFFFLCVLCVLCGEMSFAKMSKSIYWCACHTVSVAWIYWSGRRNGYWRGELVDVDPRQVVAGDQQVAEQERLVAEWADLIGRMHADGRDVRLAMELLDVFRTQLATYRHNRDRLQQIWGNDSDANHLRSVHAHAGLTAAPSSAPSEWS